MAITICLTDKTADAVIEAIGCLTDKGAIPREHFNALRAVYAQIKNERGKVAPKTK